MWEGSNTEDDAEFDQPITEQEIPDSRADDETVEKELEAHGCEDFTRLVRPVMPLKSMICCSGAVQLSVSRAGSLTYCECVSRQVTCAAVAIMRPLAW